jgi:hypothetical protein
MYTFTDLYTSSEDWGGYVFELKDLPKDSRVRAWRFSNNEHHVGDVLQPHKANVDSKGRNKSYNFKDDIGYFVAPFASIEWWLNIYNKTEFLYEVEFLYEDNMICNITDTLEQGFVRGPITIVGVYRYDIDPETHEVIIRCCR